MKLPSLFRRTPFRLTLLFLALFAAAASAILAYVYFASASEAETRARKDVQVEFEALAAVYNTRGVDALNGALVERTIRGGPYLYLLTDSTGKVVTGNLSVLPFDPGTQTPGMGEWNTFRLTATDDRCTTATGTVAEVSVTLKSA